MDYAAYANPETLVPEEMRNIAGPIIGYTGLIAARLDLPMLDDAARRRPDWSFVFVGDVNTVGCESAMASLQDLPNIHFLGRKSVTETPAYVRQFDVCMIPYVTNLRADNASPLKLYEYAAASKPIVTTRFAAAESFEGSLHIVDNADEFVTACEHLVTTEPTSADLVANQQFAAANTWDHRVAFVSDLILKGIGES